MHNTSVMGEVLQSPWVQRPSATFSVSGILALLLMCGCSGPVREVKIATAEGTVTLDGKPLQDGVVAFESRSSGLGAFGVLDADGKFRIERMPVGEFLVTIHPPEPPAPGEPAPPRPSTMGPIRKIPSKYASPTDSGLEVTIPEQGAKDLVFDLSS
ncbi:carboxypeptidase-like regulatory domain-containing protein [Planctomicrobium sp. SH664]|uniref:carboxypeptidase-like regulatory domain-containing protein n=1 Tax=Planctomicrobium sp. SH664 TaxID=3448125 RepID=UPI003F5B013D